MKSFLKLATFAVLLAVPAVGFAGDEKKCDPKDCPPAKCAPKEAAAKCDPEKKADCCAAGSHATKAAAKKEAKPAAKPAAEKS